MLQKTDVPLNVPIRYLGQATWTFAAPAFSSDGTLYLSQAKDNNGYGLTVWKIKDDLSLQALARNFSGYTFEGFYSGISKDGTLVFSVSFPQVVFNYPPKWPRCSPNCEVTASFLPTSSGIFQLPSGNQVSKLGITAVDSFEYKVDFSPSDDYLATVSHRTDTNMNVLQYIQLWRVSNGMLYRTLDPIRYEGHNGEVANLAFSPNGADLAFICGGNLKAWQWEENTIRWSVEGIFSALDYSAEGSIIATGKPDGSIQLWNASDGTPIVTLQGHQHPISAVAFSPDGRLLVSMDDDGILKVWTILQ